MLFRSEADAAAIRVRAERRIGEMMEAQPKANGAKGIGPIAGYGKTRNQDDTPTLAQAGIDKNLAHRARKYARMGEDEFEDEVAKVRHKVMHRENFYTSLQSRHVQAAPMHKNASHENADAPFFSSFPCLQRLRSGQSICR